MKLIYPGSFDPPTFGHLRIVERALLWADAVVIAVGDNSAKQDWFTVEERLDFWQELLLSSEQLAALTPAERAEKISFSAYNGLLIDCARAAGVDAILRSARNTRDFEMEQSLAAANLRLAPELETLILPAEPGMTQISSTLVRECARYRADLSGLVPISWAERLYSRATER